MEPVTAILAFAPVVQGILAVYKKIDAYKKIYKTQEDKLGAVLRELSIFATLLNNAENILADLKQRLRLSPQERDSFRKVLKDARKLGRAFKRFVEQKNEQHRRYSYFFTERWTMGRRWTKDMPGFDLLVWRLGAQRGSLSLLIGLAQLRILTKELQLTYMNPRLNRDEQKRQLKSLQDRLISARQIVSCHEEEMESHQKEYARLSKGDVNNKILAAANETSVLSRDIQKTVTLKELALSDDVNRAEQRYRERRREPSSRSQSPPATLATPIRSPVPQPLDPTAGGGVTVREVAESLGPSVLSERNVPGSIITSADIPTASQEQPEPQERLFNPTMAFSISPTGEWVFEDELSTENAPNGKIEERASNIRVVEPSNAVFDAAESSYTYHPDPPPSLPQKNESKSTSIDNHPSTRIISGDGTAQEWEEGQTPKLVMPPTPLRHRRKRRD